MSKMTDRLVANAPLADQSLGDIASQLPGATTVFRAYKLDFCCGGGVTLRAAAAERNLDLAAIEAALLALDRPADAALSDEPAPLIDHIVDRYHGALRRELPELIRLAKKVEAVHRDHPKVPAGLATLLETMLSELEIHMQKEEGVLFPMMKAGGNPMIVHPISCMRHEHDDHGAHLRTAESLTGDVTTPEDACPTWKALYAGLHKLIDDLMEHIHLENNVLFPQFLTPQPPAAA